jgi:hypothetical protein
VCGFTSRSSYDCWVKNKLLVQLPKRVPAPSGHSFSTGLALQWRLSSVDTVACADKAHKVHGGGAEACSSTPHAANISTLIALQPPLGVVRSQVPDLVHGLREPLDWSLPPAAAQAGPLVDVEITDPRPSKGGRGRRASTWQLQLSHRAPSEHLPKRGIESTSDVFHANQAPLPGIWRHSRSRPCLELWTRSQSVASPPT